MASFLIRTKAWFAIAILTVLVATSAAAKPVTQRQVEEMVGASPQRELKRAWEACLVDAIQIGLMNGLSARTELERFSYAACEQRESRLTGELAKRFGLERANAAVAIVKQAYRDGFEDAEKAARAKPRDYFSQTASGWTIFKSAAQSCSAKSSSSGFAEPSLSWIKMTGGSWTMVFATEISYAPRYANRSGHTEAVEIDALANSTAVAHFAAIVRYEVGPDYLGFSIPIDETVVARPATADRVQFEAMADDRQFPRVFPVKGIQEAWRLVQDCQRQRQRQRPEQR